MVRSMMSQKTLPKSFWDYVLETAARILNMVPTKKVEKTPYEVWHRKAPKLSYLKVWGCEALVKRDTLTKPDKLKPRSTKCIFVGYPKETMGYSFYYPPENKVYMKQPEGFVNPKYQNRVCKLKRSIYRLKQASRQWNKQFDDEIKKFGFIQNRDEPCVYQKASGSNITFLILYVDDILIMGNSIPMLQSVKTYLGKCFAMKDLEAKYIAAFDASKEAVWVRKFISGLRVVPIIEEPISMYCDNTGAIAIANKSEITKGARHFHAKVHYLREVIELGDIKLEKFI
nr:putative retrotransposon protein [Tanacetum cinerariifolium]